MAANHQKTRTSFAAERITAMPRKQPSGEYLTIAQVCAKLNISRSTVVNLATEGHLEMHRLSPRCFRISSASVDKFLNDTLQA